MKELLVVIPAIKKNAVIPDQLIKKLNGITLIQRAIDTAMALTESENIFVVTDSEEIALIAERSGIGYYKDSAMSLNSDNILQTIGAIVKDMPQSNILLYRANTPLVDSEVLQDAYNVYLTDTSSILTSVRQEGRKLLKQKNDELEIIKSDTYFEELKAFHIFAKSKLCLNDIRFKPYVICNEKSIEIENYQDWWVCEKVLQRKRIVFNVIGDVQIGMGHIYHSLALAHEITDHEVLFVCHEQYKLAVDRIASMDYKVFSTSNVLEKVLQLKPDLVINDVLNTEEPYIASLKQRGIKVINFEDLGSGSKFADLVFNELYDDPQCEGDNYMWGHQYLALRDEFDDARPHEFISDVSAVLIAFGGTDQNNLTLATLCAIVSASQQNDIKIYIVCGSGYGFKEEIESFIKGCEYKNIELTYASGVISKIMEKTQIAISSNGRTVYELADMSIPAIVVSHHEREATHSFAMLENGFINLGTFNIEIADKIRIVFEKLIADSDYRKLLFLNTQRFNFRKNKQKVVNTILGLL
jgi:spore coat polysaccharide biosynthesis predicted glycosyltransferase SpsG/CMP-N-acetylneuraminic acid synthetase